MTTEEFINVHRGGRFVDIAHFIVKNVDEDEVLFDIAQEFLFHHEELAAELEVLNYEWG